MACGVQTCFTVVHDSFLTDTADYADVVLPAPTFLEQDDVQGAYGHYFAQMSRRAADPPGEVRSNVWLFSQLAQRMGFAEPCFRDTDDDLIRQALDSAHPWHTGITYERLQAEHRVPLALPLNERGEFLPFSDAKWFKTPSGRGEFYSDTLATQGLDPLPAYVPHARVRRQHTAAAPAGAQGRPLDELDLCQPAASPCHGRRARRARSAGDAC